MRAGVPTRVGIVGTGFMAGVHAAAWRESGADVVAFLERADTSRVGDLGRYDADFYSDADQGLGDFLNAVDVVDICAPTFLHAGFALKAAAAGKPTLCEKPLALNAEDGLRVVQTFEERGVPLFVGHVLRFDPAYVAVRQAVLEGEVGKLAVLRLSRRSFAPRRGPRSWFLDESKSGGIIFDLMIHDLDYALWLGGRAESVFATMTSESGGHAQALIRHRNEAISIIESSWLEPAPIFRTSAEVTGSQGVVGYNSESTTPTTLRLHDSGKSDVSGLPDIAAADNPFELEVQHFLEVVASRSEPIVSARDALEVVRLAVAVRQSVATGLAVTL